MVFPKNSQPVFLNPIIYKLDWPILWDWQWSKCIRYKKQNSLTQKESKMATCANMFIKIRYTFTLLLNSVQFVKKAVGCQAPKVFPSLVGRGLGRGYGPQKNFYIFISKYCILVHFRILIQKFYLPSNAEKSTSLHCILQQLTVIQTWKHEVVINLVNFSPSPESVPTRNGFITAAVGMCYRPKIIIYELQMQATL